jgi:hypothetical protein
MSAPRYWKGALAGLLIAGAAAPALAQSASKQPYAGWQTRQLKALPDQQVADLAAGRGIGLALAAELNGYPGPRHVLDLAGPLGLTGAQREEIRRLFDSMQSEAVPLGQKLIAAEQDLDRAFAERTITPDRLEAATAAIAAVTGELRNAHLKYHLATAALLGLDQIRRYGELRGYGEAAAGAVAHHAPASGTPCQAAAEGSMHPHGDAASGE